MEDKTADPKFYSLVYIPFSEPSLSQTLVITFYDHDSVGENDIIGTLNIKKKDFIKYRNWKWINLYGAYGDYKMFNNIKPEIS